MSLQTKLQVDWKAHLEALPLATWIVRCNAEPSLSQNQYVSVTCGPVFANQACRDALGITAELDELETAQAVDVWQRYLHPEDRQDCLVAWTDFVQGNSPSFHRFLRWIRPDNKETVALSVRAQRLLCGDIQGWLRSTAAEQALSKLEELTHGRR